MIDQYTKFFVATVLFAIPGCAICCFERCPCNMPSWEDGGKFVKKVSRFWEFKESSRKWEEVRLPFDLVSCVNNTCLVAGSIEVSEGADTKHESAEHKVEVLKGASDGFLPLRRRISVTKLSESSVWVTGVSGSIYERFWNGVRWVIAPRELPVSAGPATSVFLVNQTILALSEAGVLYELQLNESEQTWGEVNLMEEGEAWTGGTDLSAPDGIKFLAVSKNGEKLCFSSRNGMLVEINQLLPLRWTNYGRPPGADVSGIADIDSFKEGVVFTVSSKGELFEFDKNSKPSWKKHIWTSVGTKETKLATLKGCCPYSSEEASSQSLFLISKDGYLLERQLYNKKWKWVVHGAPQGHHLSSITTTKQDEVNKKQASMFFTTSTGSVLEYQLSKHSGSSQDNQVPEKWVNHYHPEDTKVAREVSGIQLNFGRMIFPLDDGRLAELHLSSIGGEDVGPANQVSIRRRATSNYEWSILDAPETEGWNAEYCSEKIGPTNCFAGAKSMIEEDEFGRSTRRYQTQAHKHYLAAAIHANHMLELPDRSNVLTTSMDATFRMRAMHPEKSFLYVTEKGVTLEYRSDWSSAYGSGIWLQHEYSKPMKSVVGNLNGSMFLVDKHGHLLLRERKETELSWIDCTSIDNGKTIATGAPWDLTAGRGWKFTPEDALYFINKKGKLLQLTVALRKFKWKNCNSPPNVKIATIVDREIFRTNIIFVVGRNGKLYQYNRVTELWHEHLQSPYLVLSSFPGAALRPSDMSTTGSLFMIHENGGLVEYHWNSAQGWKWIEHGTPGWSITLVAAPGPTFENGQIFLIGSDGHVYRRYLDQGVWKWASSGYPESRLDHEPEDLVSTIGNIDKNGGQKNCNDKVAAVRPIAFSEYSVIFQLQDGRLAELRRSEVGAGWEWKRAIGTPTSLCSTEYVLVSAF